MNIFNSTFLNFIIFLYIFTSSLYIYSTSLVNLKNLYKNKKNLSIEYLFEIIFLVIFGSLIIFSTIELGNIIKNI